LNVRVHAKNLLNHIKRPNSRFRPVGSHSSPQEPAKCIGIP
jgi:hypothetical protein